MSETKRPYVAFISYSHRDTVWAAWIQKAIERYSLPSSFAKSTGLGRRLGKVFRDREELSTGQNLGDHLLEALDNSDNLIVICSPNAVSSQWVGKEIEYFKSIGRGDRIFALLVEGGAEALPEPLLTDIHGNPLEPLAADPRKEADGKRLAKLKIISGILNTNLDQLVQRERARQRQQRGLFLAAANVVALSIGSALYFEQAQRYEAEQKALERELGIQNVMSMTDFVKRTRQYYDKAALKYVSDEFSEYLDRFNDAELTTDQKAAKADALRVVGESTYDLGDVETSLQAYGESRDLYQSASALRPDDVDLAIEAAFSDFYVGVTHFYEGNLASAKQPLERYADQISTLFDQNPDHPVLLSESVAAPTALLSLLVESSDRMNSKLAAQIQEASSAVDLALEIAPNNAEILYLAQGPMDYAADAHMKSCEVSNALAYQKRAVEYARSSVTLDPRNRQYKTNLANALFSYAGLPLASATPTVALESYLEAHELQTSLIVNDPENEYLRQRFLNTQIELFSITVFHPEFRQTLADLGLANVIDLEQSAGLSPTLDLYLLALSTHQREPELAQKALDSFYVLSKEDGQSVRTELAIAMHRLAEILLGTDLEFSITSTDTPKLPDCNSRFIDWANQELAGDYNAADNILAEAEMLGLSGTLIRLYSEEMKAMRPK